MPPGPAGEFDRKSKRYSREVFQKVKKTSRESVGREREHRKLQLILPIWNSAPVPWNSQAAQAAGAEGAEVVAWTAARDLPNTRRGSG